jgi:hypothetical protein
MENSTYCVQEVARLSFGISMFFKIWFMTNSLNRHILGAAYFFSLFTRLGGDVARCGR